MEIENEVGDTISMGVVLASLAVLLSVVMLTAYTSRKMGWDFYDSVNTVKGQVQTGIITDLTEAETELSTASVLTILRSYSGEIGLVRNNIYNSGQGVDAHTGLNEDLFTIGEVKNGKVVVYVTRELSDGSNLYSMHIHSLTCNRTKLNTDGTRTSVLDHKTKANGEGCRHESLVNGVLVDEKGNRIYD